MYLVLSMRAFITWRLLLPVLIVTILTACASAPPTLQPHHEDTQHSLLGNARLVFKSDNLISVRIDDRDCDLTKPCEVSPGNRHIDLWYLVPGSVNPIAAAGLVSGALLILLGGDWLVMPFASRSGPPTRCHSLFDLLVDAGHTYSFEFSSGKTNQIQTIVTVMDSHKNESVIQANCE